MRHPDQLLVLAAEMVKPMEAYLKWKQICNRYERGKHNKLSEIMLSVDEGGGVERVKAKAYAHPDWVEYLEEWDKAEKNMVKAQVKYDTSKANYEAFQSALAFDRESMKRG